MKPLPDSMDEGGTRGNATKGSPGGAMAPEVDAGAAPAKNDKAVPVAGQPSASAMDAGMTPGAKPAMREMSQMNDPLPMKQPATPNDGGAADAQPGGPTVTTKKQPEAAGAESMPPPIGSMTGLPMAGAASMMPADPACMPSFPGASCDTAPQCGCTQGDNCAYLSSLDFPTCVRAGAAGLNQGCSLSTDCQVGLQCIGGACLRQCDPNQQACDDEAACNQNFSVSGRAIPGHFTCSSNCDLVNPQSAAGTFAACGSGLTCILYGKGTDCARSLLAVGRHGEHCDSSLDCAPGYNCTNTGTCARWCETSNDCPDGYSCEDIDVSVRDTRYGLCRASCGGSSDVACEIETQCGCEGNMACDMERKEGNVYIHVCRQAGRGAPYTRCEEDDDCIGGTSCVGGQCGPFCERDSECGGPYAQCVQVHNGALSSSPPIPGFNICQRPCDPADLTRPHGPYQSCPAGDGCATTRDGISYCREANDEAEPGAACTYSSDCAVGYECSSNYGCSLLCLTNADCGTGYNCAAFSPKMWAEQQEWGICIPAQ